MYLSRVELDITKKQTQLALASRNKIHGAIEASFCCDEGRRLRKLWRVDKLNGKIYLLLLSDQKPDLSNFVNQFGNPLVKSEIKDYNILLRRITDQSIWHFRLVANPTKCMKCQNGRGKRVAHVTAVHQIEWLNRQAEKHGFIVMEDAVQVKESTWLMFNKRGERMVRALAVTYEGVLRVNDVEKFKKTLIEGIGREKAYGMGLLTITRKTL